VAGTATTELSSTAPPLDRGNQPGRLGPRWLNRLRAWLGLPAQRRHGRAVLHIDAIRRWETELSQLSDADLLRCGQQLRGRARGGEALERLLPEAFGAMCVAATRALGLRPFDVQLAGAVVMHYRALAELATGEGKTLTALLPTFLNALPGKGAHVATVNDYLADRDGRWAAPAFAALGLTVGILQNEMEDTERQHAYAADVTYGTASGFGFDFLRDQLKVRRAAPRKRRLLAPWSPHAVALTPADPPVQRGHYFALVDEADNIFIDEARTPLVIAGRSGPAPAEEQAVYRWADGVAQELRRGRDFALDEKRQHVELTPHGRQRVRWSAPPAGPQAPAMKELYEHVERALQAHHRLRRDQHYLAEDDVVEIIDETTGRRMPGRQWGDGLHQAVEAKEAVTITGAAGHAAQVTYQSYFRLYEKLAGMTGTAVQNWRELYRVYRLRVVCVPTNRPVRRQHWPDRIFPSEDAKFAAVVDEVVRLQGLGRPVLIGTRSVKRSEMLSARLTQRGIEHEVLNARQHAREADIVAQAGQPGRVTIATNMAGRGTDIKLGPGVAEAGGLHVLATERHESIRIDRQLAGRTGRQGDAGSCQFFLSLEDELLDGLGAGRRAYYRMLGRRGDRSPWDRYGKLFRRAQRRLERRYYRERVDLMLYERRRQETLQDLAADPYVD
jgi:preprotein translocase subunit SecA